MWGMILQWIAAGVTSAEILYLGYVYQNSGEPNGGGGGGW